jgi:hypothetical protein
MNRRIEFTVDRLTAEAGRAFVDGRVCQSPIRVGDIFTKIRDPGAIHTVRLVIQSLESYRRLWNELPPA